MERHTLPKASKLCSEVVIERLFSRRDLKPGEGRKGVATCFPLRGVWIEGMPRRDGYTGSRILISVPKKKLRHAVDRVKMRRRIREAWRLLRGDKGYRTDLALIYISDRVENYETVSNAVKKILSKLPCATDGEKTDSEARGADSGEILQAVHLPDASAELPVHADM